MLLKKIIKIIFFVPEWILRNLMGQKKEEEIGVDTYIIVLIPLAFAFSFLFLLPILTNCSYLTASIIGGGVGIIVYFYLFYRDMKSFF